MFCPHCGHKANEHAKFCQSCGKLILIPAGNGSPAHGQEVAHSKVATARPTAFSLALKASRIPAGIGAAIGISAGIKATASSFTGKLILSLLTAGMVGAIFGLIAFLCVYVFHKLRGR